MPEIQRKPKKVPRQDRIERLKQGFTETEQVILQRRSVRLYKPDQVPEFMVRRILEAGRFAPSAGNCQPWKFVVLRDEKVITALTDDTVKLCDILRNMVDYRKPGASWMKPMVKFNTRIRKNDLHPVPFGAMSMIADRKLGLWHNAPTVILIFGDRRGVSCPELDCGIAGQNMVLAAHSMGLGTCWVGFVRPAFDYMLRWKKFFDISYPYKFMSSLAVGWPVGEPDGMVERQTHAVDWYEDGLKKVVY
jgi:nitroreductase